MAKVSQRHAPASAPEGPRSKRHAEFARRFAAACDANPEVPDLHYGRTTWIAERIQEKYGMKVSSETVRKWSEGDTMPRPERAVALSNVIGIAPTGAAMFRLFDLDWDDVQELGFQVDGGRRILINADNRTGEHVWRTISSFTRRL